MEIGRMRRKPAWSKGRSRCEEAPAVSGEGFMVELSGVEPLTS